MEKKYQIFISSTYTDLVEERKAVQETILSMYHIPIGMEMFSADDKEQWEIIKDTINSSDYYVLIIGHRYGSLTKEGISYTQKEYEYALENKIPILGFMIDPSVPILPSNMETEPEKIIKLNEFKDLVKKKPIEWWTDKKDLSTKVTIALTKQFARNNRPGWIRADKFNLEETQNEIIQLIRKNRELEDENRKLKEQEVKRYPKIDVQILLCRSSNLDKSSLQTQLRWDSNLVESSLQIINLDRESFQILPTDKARKIERDIEVDYYKIEDDFLDESQKKDENLLKEIEEYNKNFPSKQVLEDYANELKGYTAIKEYNNPIEIQISNLGTCSAKRLSINLEFPDGIIIKDKRALEDLEKPVAPKKQPNPLYKKFDYSFMQDLIPKNFWINDDLKTYRILPLSNRCDELMGNVLEINSQDLMHTYTLTIDNYVIAALKPGQYIVKCEIMCEEYIEPEEKEIILEF